mmetsp:Transcript_17422/g.56693  ORF Transcript_17422/g.56693 Transcript_17422/m.56693 type:complete len:373 (+) Transcript_17422:399-1517(+)
MSLLSSVTCDRLGDAPAGRVTGCVPAAPPPFFLSPTAAGSAAGGGRTGLAGTRTCCGGVGGCSASSLPAARASGIRLGVSCGELARKFSATPASGKAEAGELVRNVSTTCANCTAARQTTCALPSSSCSFAFSISCLRSSASTAARISRCSRESCTRTDSRSASVARFSSATSSICLAASAWASWIESRAFISASRICLPASSFASRTSIFTSRSCFVASSLFASRTREWAACISLSWCSFSSVMSRTAFRSRARSPVVRSSREERLSFSAVKPTTLVASVLSSSTCRRSFSSASDTRALATDASAAKASSIRCLPDRSASANASRSLSRDIASARLSASSRATLPVHTTHRRSSCEEAPFTPWRMCPSRAL